ncbi:MAG: glycosyltransferase family 39 protein [Acidobacteriota bacterium]
MPGLRAFPIFGDEAIYLHWAQLIAARPFAAAFVSLQDPKPPLHFWFLALWVPLFEDPVFAGRILSVAAGAASIWLAAGVARETAKRFGLPELSRSAGAGAALFAVFCPFAAFYQRLALAESLFVAECLAAVWLALRVASGKGRRAGALWPGRGLALGAVLGAAMLSRQSFSYVLWALPPAALLCLRSGERATPAAFSLRMFLAAAVALIFWSPYLLAPGGPSLAVRAFHLAAYREPLSFGRRIENLSSVALSITTYLTPPVALFALFSLAWLFAVHRRRAAAFLVAWFAVATLPLALFGSIFFSRYALSASIPLWIACGIGLAGSFARIRSLRPRATRTALAAAAVAVLFAWPAAELVRQAADWESQTLTVEDRRQYSSGWPAGPASEAAVEFLKAQARRGPIVLITPEISGNPTDAAWVLFRGNPRVGLFSVKDVFGGPVRRDVPGRPGNLRLFGDLRELGPDAPVDVAGRRVFFIAPDPLVTPDGWRPAEQYLRLRNPSIAAVARFVNPPGERGVPPAAVTVFRLP